MVRGLKIGVLKIGVLKIGVLMTFVRAIRERPRLACPMPTASTSA